MKVYTTNQFNEQVLKLSNTDRKIVYRFFNDVAKLGVRSYLVYPEVTGIRNIGNQNIIELHNDSLRIYSTIQEADDSESLVFLGVEKGLKRSTTRGGYFQPRKRGSVSRRSILKNKSRTALLDKLGLEKTK